MTDNEGLKLNKSTYILMTVTILIFSVLEILQTIFYIVEYNYGIHLLYSLYEILQIWCFFSLFSSFCLVVVFALPSMSFNKHEIFQTINLFILFSVNIFYFPIGIYNLIKL